MENIRFSDEPTQIFMKKLTITPNFMKMWCMWWRKTTVDVTCIRFPISGMFPLPTKTNLNREMKNQNYDESKLYKVPKYPLERNISRRTCLNLDEKVLNSEEVAMMTNTKRCMEGRNMARLPYQWKYNEYYTLNRMFLKINQKIDIAYLLAR